MSRYRLWGTIFVVSALGVALSALGCGGDKTGGDRPSTRSTASTGHGTASTSTSAAEATPIEVKETGTLKGKVVYDGTPPPRKDLTPQIEEKQGLDKTHCLKGDTKDQLWIVGGDKGVANVVVFLRPPEGKFFKVPADHQTRSDTVVMAQPFCQFEPHVVAINPSVYDAETKKQKPTGQIFKITNEAPMNHNTAWKGNQILNPGLNEIIPHGKEMIIKAKPCRESAPVGEDLISVNCDIHKWMNAKVAVFDHPYYAVTDKDGNYEIKNVPADVEVVLCHWHESMGPLKGAVTEKTTFKKGDNTKEFKIK